MGYDAVGINAYDLAAGTDFLLDLSRRSGFPWLSANLVDARDHRPLFTPSLTKRVGAITVGIIGITDPAALSAEQRGAVILPWQEVLPALTSRLGASCDLLILLSNLPAAENRRVAKTIDGINIIFESAADASNQGPEQVGNTLISQAGKQGKYLGELRCRWLPSKRWGRDRAELELVAQRKLDQVNWQLGRLNRKGLPDSGAKENPRLLTLYNKLVTVRQELTAELAELQTQEAQENSTYQIRFSVMEAALPQHPQVEEVVKAAREEVNRLGQKTASGSSPSAAPPSRLKPPGETSPYLGWPRCIRCHPGEGERWKKSRHARSYQTLIDQKQQYNLECVSCHVTGITTANAPQALALPDDRLQVGCEACHGPGRDHANAPTTAHLNAAPSAPLCLRCHTTQRDNDFNYGRDRHLIH